MKIKKFPQSCILIKSQQTKILIDAGNTMYDEKFLNEWLDTDAVLLTHRHGDHVNAKVLENFNKPIYSTKEVQDFYPNLKINIIKEGDKLKFGDLNIQAVKAVHGFVAKSGEIRENIGFMINDNKTKLYITSDTIRFDNDYKCDVLFANITAFDASMNLWGASLTYAETGAKLLVVAHQDTGKMMYSKEQIQNYLKEQNINYIIPCVEEEFEI